MDFISIHALREEGDLGLAGTYKLPDLFLSTPSARRATEQAAEDLHRVHISIHALREEGDPFTKDDLKVYKKFLSTPSARRATRLNHARVL